MEKRKAVPLSEIETSIGEEFEVELEAVPTSGFQWQVARVDPARVRLVSDDIEVTSERIGGPALQRFRFEALEPGEAELRLELRRPWESKPPAEERTYRVTVRG
jgi:inhibitor of cysteine peptidase